MPEGFSQGIIGGFSVYSDLRPAHRCVDRKAFPRSAEITEMTLDDLTKQLLGSHTGPLNWQRWHSRWSHVREVFPALVVERPQAPGVTIKGLETPVGSGGDGGDSGGVQGGGHVWTEGQTTDPPNPDDSGKPDVGERLYVPLFDEVKYDEDLVARRLDDIRLVGDDTDDSGPEARVIAEIPGNWPGLVVRGTDDEEQQPIFFPAGHPLVAHHAPAEPDKFSSYVYEIWSQRLDNERRGRLDSCWWVKFLPPTGAHLPEVYFEGDAVVAMNYRKSGGPWTGWGLYVDVVMGDTKHLVPDAIYTEGPRGSSAEDGDSQSQETVVTPVSSPGDPSEPEDPFRDATHVLAFLPSSMHGPDNAGAALDQHWIGTNKDGENINSGHHSIYTYRNVPGVSPLYDSPAEHDLDPWERAGDGGYWHHVRMRWDKDAFHQHFGHQRIGLWKREVRTPWAPPTYTPPEKPPELIPPDREPPFGGRPPVFTPPDDGGKPPTTARPPISQRDDRILPAPFDTAGTRDQFSDHPETDPEVARWSSYTQRKAPAPMTFTHLGVGIPYVNFQPEPILGQCIHAPESKHEPRDIYDATQRPWVARLVGFGASLLDCEKYTTTAPKGERYPVHSTGPGGIAVLPPEHTKRLDYVGPISTTYFGLHESIGLGWFGSLTDSGKLASGPQFTFDGTNTLTLQQYDSDGTGIAAGAAGDVTLQVVGDLVVDDSVTFGALTADRVVVTDAGGALTTTADLQWDIANARLGIGNPGTFASQLVQQTAEDTWEQTDLIYEAYNSAIRRTALYPSGIQKWMINNGAAVGPAECGQIHYSTPSNYLGISFYDPSVLQRTDLRHYQNGSIGGFEIASHAAGTVPAAADIHFHTDTFENHRVCFCGTGVRGFELLDDFYSAANAWDMGWNGNDLQFRVANSGWKHRLRLCKTAEAMVFGQDESAPATKNITFTRTADGLLTITATDAVALTNDLEVAGDADIAGVTTIAVADNGSTDTRLFVGDDADVYAGATIQAWQGDVLAPVFAAQNDNAARYAWALLKNDDSKSLHLRIAGSGVVGAGSYAQLVSDGEAMQIGLSVAKPLYLRTSNLDRVTVAASGDVTLASGLDLFPTDATGQTLGDATHRWEAYAENVYLGANADCRLYRNDANVIRTPDSLIVDGDVAVGHTDPDTAVDISGALTLRELSLDPDAPDDGACVIWMSDGAESGDAGDIMVMVTSGEVTKIATLVDFSAL